MGTGRGTAESPAGARPAAPAAGPVSDRGKWLVLAAVGVGTYMSALDASVVNTMLPIIGRALHAGVAAIEWVVIIYLLVVSALLLGVGRLGDLRGNRDVYIAGFVVFVLASAACGASPSVPVLVICRGVQGIGAAMLFANSPAILTKTFPGTERGRALGLQAMMTYLGLTTGPSLGGWLAGAFGWRAIFYINVPVGSLAVLLSLRFIPRDRPRGATERFDVAGAALFATGLTLVLLALNQGHAWGWGSTRTLGFLGAGVGTIAVFVGREMRARSPMLDLRLFRDRLFSASTASALLNYICIYSVSFVLPFYLIRGRGRGPEAAGLLMSAQPVVMAVAAPLSGALSDRIGSRFLSTAGMAILGAGLVLLSRLDATSSTGAIILGLAVVGLGTGIFISPNNSALMGAAPRERQGIAAGVLATARNVGMVLGVGLAGAVFTSVLARQAGAPGALFAASRASFVVAALVAAIGTGTSLVRE